MPTAMLNADYSLPKYQRIDHTPHFQEMILTDFSRIALDAMAKDVDHLYETDGKTAPYIRTLMDVRFAFAMTPYAAKIFTGMARNRVYATKNIRVVILVKNTVFMHLISELVRVVNQTTPVLGF